MANLVQWFGPENKTEWTSTKIYRSDTGEEGQYNEIAMVKPVSTTHYWDTSGDDTSWYKVAYHNENQSITGPLSSPMFGGKIMDMYSTPTELRRFMQFSSEDFPNDEDVTLFLQQAHIQMEDDAAGTNPITNPGKLKLLSLLIGATFVCRSLATKALSKGYVSVSLEGANIMKAHEALLRLAEYYFEKYQEQLAKDMKDYTMTSFLDPAIGSVSQQNIKDIQNGVRDALDFQSQYYPSINNRTGIRRG